MDKKESVKFGIKCILGAIILVAIFIGTGAFNLWFIFKKPFTFAIVVFIILSIIALIFLIIFLIIIYQTYKNRNDPYKEDVFEKIFLS